MFSGGTSGTFADAINDAQANHEHGRGSGPVISNFSGNAGGTNFSFDIGMTVGNLWFDQDTDNNGVADDTATLEASWHFDHTTDVAAGKDDFYSVALHETLHAIGFGGSDSWDDLVSGTDWLGTEVIALNGTGSGIIDGGGAHFVAGLMSTSIVDGAVQEVVMDPNITQGTRKYLTALDIALLRDIGYVNASSVPEPSGLLSLTMIGSCVVLRRRKTNHLVGVCS